ncbi:MAG: TorF family putative porin [Sphingomonadales bacterium]|jgi:uncharacterized protein (TIGR02001 family)
MSFLKYYPAIGPLLAVFAVTPSLAQNELEVSGNVGLYSDYRFRGVSLSDEDFAIQGGLDLSYGNFYLGTWASSIESFNGSEAEVDIYGGLNHEFGGVNFSAGFLLYAYPGADDSNYVEITAAASKAFEFGELTLGVNYAPDQGNIGDQDNVYLYSGASVPVKDTPISIDAGFGYEDGAFGDKKLDWYLGASATFYKIDFGVRYIDTDASDQFGSSADSTVVFSVGTSF